MFIAIVSALSKYLKIVVFQLPHQSVADLAEFLCKENLTRRFLVTVVVLTYRETLKVSIRRKKRVVVWMKVRELLRWNQTKR